MDYRLLKPMAYIYSSRRMYCVVFILYVTFIILFASYMIFYFLLMALAGTR